MLGDFRGASRSGMEYAMLGRRRGHVEELLSGPIRGPIWSNNELEKAMPK